MPAQSGSAWRRWPCFVPAFLYSFASRSLSVTVSGSGQSRPVVLKRSIVSRTVDAASPVRRAISCVEIPANPRRKTSRTRRMATLPAGINPLLSQSQRSGPYAQPAEAPVIPHPPGDIIPEWWARIDRNAGRRLIGIGGRHHSGIGGRLAPESAPLILVGASDPVRAHRKLWLRSITQRRARSAPARDCPIRSTTRRGPGGPIGTPARTRCGSIARRCGNPRSSGDWRDAPAFVERLELVHGACHV